MVLMFVLCATCLVSFIYSFMYSFFFFKQKTAYEMRISDWSSDVCSSDLLERLPDASLDRLYLLHPDPWPKARHAKRRMVNDGPLDLIAAKLKPGCEFRLGTDDPTYCRWSMMVMNRRRDFRWLAATPHDFLTRPDDWPETRYERKARRKGHEVWYFTFRRK